MGDKIVLNFDESGNMGRKGRYFSIACVETENSKPLSNVMKKSILKVKTNFPEYKDYDEIKASDSNPVIKDFLLRKIASKDLFVHYVVSDLKHVKQSLIRDENLLYNYMLQFIIVPIARRSSVNELIVNLDKRLFGHNKVINL